MGCIMLEYNEILPKKVILIDGEPYEVIEAQVSRKQKRKPQNQVKMRNLITGRVVEQAFHAAEKAEEADLTRREVKFLYQNRGQWWFCDVKDASNRFELPEATVGDGGKFLKANSTIEALMLEERVISLKLPVKVDLVVKEAPPAVRGNTSSGGTKQIILETGAVVNAPLFINEGDVVRINTETGDYVERMDKK